MYHKYIKYKTKYMQFRDMMNKYGMQLVTSGQLSQLVENKLSDKISDKDNRVEEMPWSDSALSDHMPVSLVNDNYKIISYNLLNPLWLEWMVKDNLNGQRLGHCWFADEKNTDERLEKQNNLIIEWLKQGFIVCLQEVNDKFYRDKLLKSVESLQKQNIDIKSHDVHTSEHNLNVTLYDKNRYNLLDTQTIVPKRDDDKIDFETKYIKLQNVETQYVFNLANVHVDFGTNKYYIEAYKKFAEKMDSPTIVCGDFNAMCRIIDDVSECEHITLYTDDIFRFPVPNDDELPTHVNSWKNVKTTQKQYDKFDHFMFII